MVGIGPFSIQVVIAAIAVLAAWIAARLLAMRLQGEHRKAAGGLVFDAVFWGLVAARLGYIAQWWSDYAASPMAMLAIGDGGFAWWAGAPVALAIVWWRTRSVRPLRLAALAGILAGVMVWAVAGVAVDPRNRDDAPTLPDVTLATLDAQPVGLDAYAGRPVVLNLWASWCPPCRREMPVFEQAQAAFPDVAFVMVNQGESPQQAQDFLADEGLSLTDVLLDPSSETMRIMRTAGLPSTFFFDARGRLVDLHMGEITMASLRDKVARRF